MFSTSHPPPPIQHHRTTQISQSRALELISAYLDATKATTDLAPTPTAPSPSPSLSSPNNPPPTSKSSIPSPAPRGAALHPNAVLTEAGPVAPGGGAAGLVLRNLERVRAGLKGEMWAPGLGEVGLGEGSREPGDLGGEMEMEMEGADRKEGWEEGWQDKEEFEREQEQDVFVRDEDVTGKEGPSVKARLARMEEETGLPSRRGGGTVIDKEARKKAKSQRRKEEKRLREMARKNGTSPGE